VRGTLIATVVALTVVFAGAEARAGLLPTSKLALAAVPSSAMGGLAGNLSLRPDSGPDSNAQAADDANGNVTAAQLEKLGRLGGYKLGYGSPFVGGSGLRQVSTNVSSYRSVAAARAAFRFWRRDEENTGKLAKYGLHVELRPFSVPSVGDERWGAGGRLTLAGAAPVFGGGELVRSGAYLIEVETAAADLPTAEHAIRQVASIALRRLAAVQAGTLTGSPIPIPPPHNGPPAGGPDLAKLVLGPADLGGGTVTHSGYQADKDVDPVSEYAISMSPGGNFVELDEHLMLMHDADEAKYVTAVYRAVIARPGAFTDPSFKSVAIHAASVSAGDESYGAIVSIRLKTGQRVDNPVVVVRKGSYVAFANAGDAGVVPASAAQDLARRVAAKLP
jgi:hypothetical protein